MTRNEIFAKFGKALQDLKISLENISDSASDMDFENMLDAVQYELSVLRSEKI